MTSDSELEIEAELDTEAATQANLFLLFFIFLYLNDLSYILVLGGQGWLAIEARRSS